MRCKQCGRCCKELKLEIMEIDLVREPRLRAAPVPLDDSVPDNPFEKSYILPHPCSFRLENNCMIYDTRPNICVAFSDKCLNKRGK